MSSIFCSTVDFLLGRKLQRSAHAWLPSRRSKLAGCTDSGRIGSWPATIHSRAIASRSCCEGSTPAACSVDAAAGSDLVSGVDGGVLVVIFSASAVYLGSA